MDKMSSNKLLIAFFIMMSLAIAISGCMSNPTSLSNTSVSSADFSIITMEPIQPQSLDPAFCYGSGGLEIIQNVYQTLLFYNGSSTSDLVGVLAK